MKLGMMAVFLEKIAQGIVQPDRTGNDGVLQRKSVCFTPVMHGPIFEIKKQCFPEILNVYHSFFTR